MKYDTNELKGIRRILLMQCITVINALLLCVNFKEQQLRASVLINTCNGRLRSKGGSLY